MPQTSTPGLTPKSVIVLSRTIRFSTSGTQMAPYPKLDESTALGLVGIRSVLEIVLAVMVRFLMLMTSTVLRRLKKPTGPMPHRPMLRIRLRLIWILISLPPAAMLLTPEPRPGVPGSKDVEVEQSPS